MPFQEKLFMRAFGINWRRTPCDWYNRSVNKTAFNLPQLLRKPLLVLGLPTSLQALLQAFPFDTRVNTVYIGITPLSNTPLTTQGLFRIG